MHELELHIGEDNLIEWEGMLDSASKAYVNNATTTFTLKDSTGSTFSGASGVTMDYVASSNGNYQGVLSAGVELVRNAAYWLEISATSGALTGFRRIRCIALYHGAE